MAETIVVLSGDDSKLLQAFNRAIAKEQEMANGFKGVEGASKKATDSSVADANRQEREWKKSADVIYREHKKLLDAKASESRKAGQAEEALARQTAFGEVNAAIRAADQEIKQAERILKAKQKLAGEEMKVTDGQLASLQQTIKVSDAVTKAVGLATQAWQEYSKAQGKALGSLEGLDPANRKLAQVATSAEDLTKMQARADAAAMATGVSRAEARDVLFNARSEGYEGSYEAILASNSVVSPTAQAKVAGKLPAIFKGAIGPMEAVSLALKGSNESNLDFEQMAPTLAIAGEGGAVLGASPEETVAIASVLSARFKSGEEAANRMKGFGVKAGIDQRFAGAGFMGAYKRLAALPETERKEFLGENEQLNTFYVAMSEDIDKITDQLTKAIDERKEFAAGRGELRTKLKNADATQDIATTKRVRIARIENEIATEKNLAQSAANNDIAGNKAMTKVENKNGSMINRWATSTAAFGLNLLGDRISPERKASLAAGFGDLIHRKPFNGLDALDANAMPLKMRQQSIEDSFKADAGKGPAAKAVVPNAGAIKALEDERVKLKPKITDLLEKQRITEAEDMQIKAAEFQVTKTSELASRLGNRQDTKAIGMRLDVDKARTRLNTVRQDATLSTKEAEELTTLQGKDNQYATRIEALRNEDAKNLQRATEKTNDILLRIENKLQGPDSHDTTNAMRAQWEIGKNQ